LDSGTGNIDVGSGGSGSTGSSSGASNAVSSGSENESSGSTSQDVGTAFADGNNNNGASNNAGSSNSNEDTTGFTPTTGNVEIGSQQITSDSQGAVPDTNQATQTVPADFNTNTLSLPAMDDRFNFNNGGLFDPSAGALTPDSDRARQAADINSQLPTEIQELFRRGEINFYDPGNGPYYYIRLCNNGICITYQVDRLTNSYFDALDGQRHFVKIDRSRSQFNLFRPPSGQKIPAANQITIQEGETLSSLATRFGIPQSILEAANPQVSNSDQIFTGDTLMIAALAHTIEPGESLQSLADNFGVEISALRNLNTQISNDAVNTGDIVKVPASSPIIPFAYTANSGDTISSLASEYRLNADDILAINPGVSSTEDSLIGGHVISIPNFLSFSGNIAFIDTMTNPLSKRSKLNFLPLITFNF
jgi:LysM repeat protein